MRNPSGPQPFKMLDADHSDAEAIAVAKTLAADFAVESVARDRERRLPWTEVERFSRSGLWGITVPKAHGGAEVSAVTLAEVTAIISAADGGLGPIPQNHDYMVEAPRLDASDARKRFYFQRALEGDRLGNALSEIGGKHALDYKTIPRRAGDGFILDGRKFYCPGVLFAHWIACVALDEQGRRAIVFVPRDTPGLTLLDDWTGFGQKTTASGTTIFDAIAVDAFAVLDHQKAFDRPMRMGSIAQLVHAAIDVGIARGAFAAGLDHLRRHARPYAPNGIERVTDDPHMIATIGDLQVRLSAANAMLERAGTFVDRDIAGNLHGYRRPSRSPTARAWSLQEPLSRENVARKTVWRRREARRGPPRRALSRGQRGAGRGMNDRGAMPSGWRQPRLGRECRERR